MQINNSQRLRVVFIGLLVFNGWLLTSQKHDYNWLLGYRFRDDTIREDFGITRFDFNTKSINPRIYFDTFKLIDFDFSNNNISGYYGNYLFSYNGLYIENRFNNKMKNAESGISDEREDFDVIYQNSLVLPMRDTNNYLLLHEDCVFFPELNQTYWGTGLNYSVVNVIANDGKGEMISKRVKINQDTMDCGRICAMRHANGRDWWIVASRYVMTKYYKYLLSNDLPTIHSIQNIGNDQEVPFGGVSVSPKGNKIVYFSQHEAPIYGLPGMLGMNLHLFDFDRITGLMSNSITIKVDSLIKGGSQGGAFSPNGSYYYLSRFNYIFQIDLTEPKLRLDTVAEYDGFTVNIGGGAKSRTWFGHIELGPDGRINGTSSCCAQRYMFVINKPNRKGKACDVRQHSIKITTHNSIPSFPNYRLGPIDGSKSDTLGIDNVPIAEYRYDQDTSFYRKMEFTNLSWYEPDEWWWDWGDGSSMYYTTVWDTSIIHEYAKDGIYNVCLRAKNKNGENSICKELRIGITDVKNPDSAGIDISIQPNPAHELFVVNVENYLPESMQLRMYNLQGELVKEQRLFPGSNVINVEGLSNGMYVIEVLERNEIVHTEKVVKM